MDLPGASDITLGLVAGGRGSRLGGVDKAWLMRGDEPQVLRLARTFDPVTADVLVSANRDTARLHAAGLETVTDRVPDLGPLAALEALASACATPWLFTLPVDVVEVDDGVLAGLVRSCGPDGAVARDADGLQPLVALWRVAPLRREAAAALEAGRLAVRDLQARLDMATLELGGVRFGNLNTPEELAAAGIVLPREPMP